MSTPMDVDKATKVSIEIPKASVKRVMKLNQEVSTVSAEAIVATAKATEDFLSQLAVLSREICVANHKKIIRVEDIIAAIQSKGAKYEFLEEAFAPVKVRTNVSNPPPKPIK